MVPSFLPLLEDLDPTHVHLVCLAVKTLQKLMDYSNAALTLFKDLGGVELLAHRLEIEVHRVIDLAVADDNSMVVGECSKRSDQLSSQKRLIRDLLKALGSATYAPVEMDTVSIIATFPSELREEVLLTSSDAVLSNLTPALVAEANTLRERFARRYNRSLFGTYPRNRRGETSRRGETCGGILARRVVGSKPIEAYGTTLVDAEDLKAMIRLLRIVQPLYKGHLQKLLLNLCAHGETRSALVKILIDLLLLDTHKPGQLLHSADPIYRLYACQSNVTYSRPRYVDGVPPLVSRRVLEILTFLARNHPSVAKMFLESGLPQPITPHESVNPDDKGKSIMFVDP